MIFTNSATLLTNMLQKSNLSLEEEKSVNDLEFNTKSLTSFRIHGSIMLEEKKSATACWMIHEIFQIPFKHLITSRLSPATTKLGSNPITSQMPNRAAKTSKFLYMLISLSLRFSLFKYVLYWLYLFSYV